MVAQPAPALSQAPTLPLMLLLHFCLYIGISDGLDMGCNARAALITRGGQDAALLQ
jgi:hypothetical protein